METDDYLRDCEIDKFNKLQKKLCQYWHGKDIFEQDGYDILVLPSFSIDQQVGQKVDGFLHYEERLLFSLIRLRNPKTRLIYITSQPLSPIIIE
ncbi:MAG: carboxylate-amine ligase, partial [Cyanobacteria bacterium P01_G01_bin.49]